MATDAWTAPLNWTLGQIVTEAQMDTYISDNTYFLYKHGAEPFTTTFPATPTDKDRAFSTQFRAQFVYDSGTTSWLQIGIGTFTGAYPASPVTGLVVYRVDLHKYAYWSGAAWVIQGVTSLAISAPTEITVTGSPVIDTGTIALTWANETANTLFAGPSSGGAATPTFRAAVALDTPLMLPKAGGTMTGDLTLTSKSVFANDGLFRTNAGGRYRADFWASGAGGLQINSHDDTGGVDLPIVTQSTTLNLNSTSGSIRLSAAGAVGIGLTAGITNNGDLDALGRVRTKPAGAAGVMLDGNSATGNFTLSLSPANLTADRRVTFADAALTFSNGGTLDLATFTLTVPATGTAALRASAATAGRVAYWSSATALTHDADLTFDGSALLIGKASGLTGVGDVDAALHVRAKPTGTAGIQLDPNAATGDFTFSLSPSTLAADKRATFLAIDHTVMPVGPAFSVNKNATNQTGIANNTVTKLTWSTELFDTASAFASDKFTPQIAGKYHFNASVLWVSAVDQTQMAVYIYKNGSPVQQNLIRASGTGTQAVAVASIQDANGSTDYFEVYVIQVSGGSLDVSGSTVLTFFTGHLVHSA